MEFKGYPTTLKKEEGQLTVDWTFPDKVTNDNWSLNNYFKMAMVVLKMTIEDRSSGNDPFYWSNGRVSWSIDQVNAILNHIGVVNFLNSLGDNQGGAEWKYALNMLRAYRENNFQSLPYESKTVVEWAKENKVFFTYSVRSPFQEIGEEGEVYVVIKDGVKHEMWAYDDEPQPSVEEVIQSSFS